MRKEQFVSSIGVRGFFIYSTAQYVDTLSAPTPLLINWDCIAASSEISQKYLRYKQYISRDLGTFSGPVGEKNQNNNKHNKTHTRTKQKQTKNNNKNQQHMKVKSLKYYF